MTFTLPSLDYSVDPAADFVEAKIRGANWWPEDTDQENAARLIAQMAIEGTVKRFKRVVNWEPFI